MRAGAKSCERTPLLGDAFLISAMMAGGRAARAARKSRRAGRRSAASRSHASSGWAVRARSWRFLATIRARMSGTVSIKGVDPMVSETLGGNGEVGSVSEPRKAAGAGGVVTPNPRVESISRGYAAGALVDLAGAAIATAKNGVCPAEQLHSLPQRFGKPIGGGPLFSGLQFRHVAIAHESKRNC